MKIDVFNTYVTQSNGELMHFDVLLPTGNKKETAIQYAMQWLTSLNINTASIKMDSCQFCHSEEATPEFEQLISTQGFSILQLEGCPSPIY